MTKVTFYLNAQVNPGEVIVLLGSSAELGQWKEGNGIPLTPNKEKTRWSLSVDLPNGIVEYKYVKKGAKIQWEQTSNRSLEIKGGEVHVQDGTFGNLTGRTCDYNSFKPQSANQVNLSQAPPFVTNIANHVAALLLTELEPLSKLEQENKTLCHTKTELESQINVLQIACRNLKDLNVRQEAIISNFKNNEIQLEKQIQDKSQEITTLQQKINSLENPQFEKMSRDQLRTAEVFYREKLMALSQAYVKLGEAEKTQSECIVCMEKQRNIACDPCGHMVMCSDCATHKSIKICPLCRANIVKTIKIHQ